MGQNAHFLSRKPARTPRVAVNEAHGVTRIHAFHQPAATVDSKARGGTRHGVISHPQRARSDLAAGARAWFRQLAIN